MAIVFPASPSVNEIFTEGSITYKWDGDKWIGLGITPADRLVEGSNSLEINAGNDLVWTGGDVGIGDTAPNNNYGKNLSVHSTATNGARLKISDGTTGKGNLDGLDIISTGGVAYFINRETDDMSFSTGGGEALRIKSDGVVGINNTSPSAYAQLDVVGSSYWPILVKTTSTGGGGIAIKNKDDITSLYTGSGGSSWLTGSVITDGLVRAQNNLLFATDGNSERLRIASSGQIGLGGANYGTSGQVITSNGSGSAPTWQDASGGGGGGGMEYISTQTVSSTTAQVEFDLSSTNYDFFIVKAYGCKFTAAPSNGYCVFFNVYDGAYNSGNAGTNRMSVRYQRSQHDGSTVGTSSAWAYDLTLHLGWTPTTSANFSFNAEIGGKTNSPICITSNFLEGTTTSSGCPSINGVAPNSSNNMTYMTVRPSTTTFASGTFLLYGIKNS